MYAQVEITTICNFKCFYCAGRDMPQEHMTWECFEGVLRRLPEGRYTVSLQGEGEPMAHRDFWRMAERVTQLGKVAYTITNGSLMRHPQRLADAFEAIGVSIDTLDPVEAERIGRLRLPRVLKNLERLLAHMSAERVIVHTVDYGQPLGPLRDYLAGLGVKWQITQGIQQKPDYSYRYPHLVRLIRPADYTYACRYIEERSMRYFDVRGLEMPCCFIKDTRGYVSGDHIAAELAAKRVPGCCIGCREVLAPQHSTV
jgi:hypothetical protein